MTFKTFAALVVAGSTVGFTVALGGCGAGGATQRCDDICACEYPGDKRCGDRERNQCELEAQTFIDVADSYNCANAVDTYLACQHMKHQCSMDHQYSDDDMQCMAEHMKLQQCFDSNTNDKRGAWIPDGFTFSVH